MTLDAPAMTKASASNTENLRGIEAVVSVDRVSSSEGAEGPDISYKLGPISGRMEIPYARRSGWTADKQVNG
jgi:hypothetical protein